MPWIGNNHRQTDSVVMKYNRLFFILVLALGLTGIAQEQVIAQDRDGATMGTNDPLAKASQLIRAKRYADAYDLLQSVRETHGKNREWVRLMVEADDYFVRAKGRSLLFPIDRLIYKVTLNPSDSQTRYELVDKLLAAGRFYEAELYLDGQRFVNDKDPQYLQRRDQMASRKASLTAEKIAQLKAKLATKPNDAQTLRELAYFTQISGDVEAAIGYYRQALSAMNDPEIRYELAELLMAKERYKEAMPEVEALVNSRPRNAKYKNLYASVTLFGNMVNDKTEQYLNEALQAEPNNVDMLANMSLLKVYQGKIAEADTYARRAQTAESGAHNARLDQLDTLIAEFKRTGGGVATLYGMDLEKARQFVRENKFFEGADAFEMYFRHGGPVTKQVLTEMGNAIASGGDPESAIGVLQRANQLEYDPQIVLRMAQLRYDMNDYAGTITILEELHERSSKTVGSLTLLGDAYAKAKWFVKAREAYNMGIALAPDNVGLRDRLGWATPVSSRGNDFAALLIPFARGISSRGFETRYDAFATGVSSQITLPIPVVLTANFTSGGSKGTAYQNRPGVDIKDPSGDPLGYSDTWYNQVGLGAFVDFSKPLPYQFNGQNYTNRLVVEGGLVDYAGGRTTSFGVARLYHQTPNVLRVTLGAEVNEGAQALWTPSGAQNELRLTQFSGEIGTPYGHRLLVNAGYALNQVKDKFGENKGNAIWGDLGYKTFPHAWVGASYYTLNYDNRVNFYFSPTENSYQEGMIWGLYEKEMAQQYYVRIKAGPGVLINNDFLFGRGELDTIYKFRSNVGFGLMFRTTQSLRYRNKRTTNPYNTYSILVGGVSFYWTL